MKDRFSKNSPKAESPEQYPPLSVGQLLPTEKFQFEVNITLNSEGTFNRFEHLDTHLCIWVHRCVSSFKHSTASIVLMLFSGIYNKVTVAIIVNPFESLYECQISQ